MYRERTEGRKRNPVWKEEFLIVRVLKHWNREVVQALSLEISKTWLGHDSGKPS